MVEGTETQIPELTDSYRKARRTLTMCSAVLLFWEYVGVTISGSKEQTISPLGIKVGLKNPEVVPSIIFLLTLYLFFRFYLEWSQVSPKRRDHMSARLDMLTTSLITLAAVGLYMFQILSDVRVADFVSTYRWIIYPALTVAFFVAGFYSSHVARTQGGERTRKLLPIFERYILPAMVLLVISPLIWRLINSLTSVFTEN